MWCYFGEFGIVSTNNSLIDIFLYSHYLPTWYHSDSVRRNSVLVTSGTKRVKMGDFITLSWLKYAFAFKCNKTMWREPDVLKHLQWKNLLLVAYVLNWQSYLDAWHAWAMSISRLQISTPMAPKRLIRRCHFWEVPWSWCINNCGVKVCVARKLYICCF